MLAFHNEHIASCAFLTYFTPEYNNTPDDNSPSTASLNNTPLISASIAAPPTPVPAASATAMVADKATLTGIIKHRYQPYGYGYNGNRPGYTDQNLAKWLSIELSAPAEITSFPINDQHFL